MRVMRFSFDRSLRITTLFLATASLACCDKSSQDRPRTPSHTIGNAHHGKELVSYYGCGGCHLISDVPNARGNVGPPLDDFADRVYIAGILRNTPDNLVSWVRDPQSVVPGNVMPRQGIDAQDARDIAAFLYTQK
jgi:cytochrome c